MLDNLSTGYDWAVAKGTPWSSAKPATRRWWRIIREHDVDAIIHFAGSIVVPDRCRSARLLPQQHRELPLADRMRGQVRRAPFHLFVDCRGLRQSAEVPVEEDAPTVPISPYGCSKLMTEMMLRDASPPMACNT